MKQMKQVSTIETSDQVIYFQDGMNKVLSLKGFYRPLKLYDIIVHWNSYNDHIKLLNSYNDHIFKKNFVVIVKKV